MKLSYLLLNLLIFCFFDFCFAKVSPELLSKETSLRLNRVPEFSYIQSEAKKLGIQVYLFGGTASAFAHYEFSPVFDLLLDL